MAGARSVAPESPPDPATRLRRRRHLIRRSILLAFVVGCFAIGLWHSHKPLPEGVHVATDWVDVPTKDVQLLVDSTVTDGQGRLVIRQQIFDEVMRMIDAARELVVLDFFLFNDHKGNVADGAKPYRELSRELKEHLIARKRAVPGLRVLFITDPINDVYGSAPSPELEELRDAGITVVPTNLDRLRDSNAGYSALWRLFVAWWDGDARGSGWLPNPLETGPERVTLRAWLRLLNFKANHRKLIVADDGAGDLVALVASANPHDASSAHSNLGLRFGGALARELIASEIAIARFSGWSEPFTTPPVPQTQDSGESVRVQYLTEGAIKSALMNALTTAERGEAISIAVFYLADRDILQALIDAAARDVRVRLILDPNKDAFGRTKDGVPNRPVAAELVRRSGGRIDVRWYRTHGEQFHVKLAVVQRADVLWALIGSANFTRRNLEDYNLEAAVALETGRDSALAQEVAQYFDLLWQNDPLTLREYTTDFPTYEDQSFARYWRYRLMEATGLSTF
jgi:phosphatidylserine/phosphatidylglycerophosphate/cardiolipin synthase-like enzyme